MTISVGAAVSVMFGPIGAKLGVTISVKVEMWVSAMDPTLHWVTFAELFWQMKKFGILAAIGKRLTLTVTISFAIQLCLPLIGCLTLLGVDVDVVLFTGEWPTPQLPTPTSSGGDGINMGLTDALLDSDSGGRRLLTSGGQNTSLADGLTAYRESQQESEPT